MARIDDGTGQGYSAQVTSTNRLAVSAEAIPSIALASAQRQDAFTVTTSTGTGSGLITGIPTTTETAILWIQNLSPFPLSVGGFQASTTQPGVFRLYRQPGSAGTIVTGAGVLTTPQQLNFASSKGFSGLARRANSPYTVALTIGGGTVVALGYVNAGFTDLQLQGAIILGQNDTIGLTFYNSAVGNADVGLNAIVAYLAG